MFGHTLKKNDRYYIYTKASKKLTIPPSNMTCSQLKNTLKIEYLKDSIFFLK
jgi:hypothetical protein